MSENNALRLTEYKLRVYYLVYIKQMYREPNSMYKEK